jgi:hypothetical protein
MVQNNEIPVTLHFRIGVFEAHRTKKQTSMFPPLIERFTITERTTKDLLVQQVRCHLPAGFEWNPDQDPLLYKPSCSAK